MKKKTIILLSFTWFLQSTSAQSPYMLRGDQAYHTYDRLEILRKTDSTLVNGINNTDRKELVGFLRKTNFDGKISTKDIYDIRHILADNYEFLDDTDYSDKSQQNEIFLKKSYVREPVFKYFYRNVSNFLSYESPSFSVFVNPVIQGTYLNEKNNTNTIFQNTRGIDVRAYIDNKVYIYTQLLENQRSYLSYVDERIQKFGTLPGQGFWKNYESTIIKSVKGYDFFNARAYVGFNPVKSINIEFGHGNHFIGNGVRSLLLSDYSHNYLYLKFNTRIWKFQYQNIFAELAPTSTLFNPGDRLLPKKYSASHYLAFKPNTKFEIGLFETVVFARENHFEFQYLNPVILYRAVEHFIDSPDNVILGLNLKLNPGDGISIYGQFIMDEFKLSEVKKQSGWWANKFGAQAGLKYMNALGVDHLDLQIEFNVVRPYTYAHRDTLPSYPDHSIANYSHSNQPLAHPLGANFKELLFIVRYKPNNKVYMQAKVLSAIYGDDNPGENWGGNILLPLETREKDYGNVIGQGIKTRVMALNMDISYEVFHNYFIDINAMWRQTRRNINFDQHFIGGGLRINISNIFYDY